MSSDHHPYITHHTVNALPSKPADVHSAYGTDPNQFGELRLPVGSGPHPVAVVIHGGCWLSTYADLRNSDAMADALRAEGIATWNIEYRCVDQFGGGWPGTFLDAGMATDHLRQLAEAHALDLSRVLTIGHSAGGHLALWVASRRTLDADGPLWTPDPLSLLGTIVLGGPGDLKRFTANADIECQQGIVSRLLGGLPDEVPDRYHQGSPVERLPLGIRQVFISSEYDWVVFPALGEEYTAKARAVGDEAEHIIVKNAGHHELMAPGSVTWPTIREAVREMLK
jgi:pimeloyl-ACP methyl ester carboxylesterase